MREGVWNMSAKEIENQNAIVQILLPVGIYFFAVQ